VSLSQAINTHRTSIDVDQGGNGGVSTTCLLGDNVLTL